MPEKADNSKFLSMKNILPILAKLGGQNLKEAGEFAGPIAAETAVEAFSLPAAVIMESLRSGDAAASSEPNPQLEDIKDTLLPFGVAIATMKEAEALTEVLRKQGDQRLSNKELKAVAKQFNLSPSEAKNIKNATEKLADLRQAGSGEVADKAASKFLDMASQITDPNIPEESLRKSPAQITGGGKPETIKASPKKPVPTDQFTRPTTDVPAVIEKQTRNIPPSLNKETAIDDLMRQSKDFKLVPEGAEVPAELGERSLTERTQDTFREGEQIANKAKEEADVAAKQADITAKQAKLNAEKAAKNIDSPRLSLGQELKEMLPDISVSDDAKRALQEAEGLAKSGRPIQGALKKAKGIFKSIPVAGSRPGKTAIAAGGLAALAAMFRDGDDPIPKPTATATPSPKDESVGEEGDEDMFSDVAEEVPKRELRKREKAVLELNKAQARIDAAFEKEMDKIEKSSVFRK